MRRLPPDRELCRLEPAELALNDHAGMIRLTIGLAGRTELWTVTIRPPGSVSKLDRVIGGTTNATFTLWPSPIAPPATRATVAAP